jgi:hypothetical protein
LLTQQGVDPQSFVNQMVDHWSKNLENVPNESLKAAWHQIASVFTRHIQNHDKQESVKEWTVLSPPTGSGKTESIVVYCSMLSERSPSDHPGVLVVTRQIDDCDKIAERINRYGSNITAIAYHSKVSDRINMKELRRWPVVVITHKQYEMALDFLGQEVRIEQTWSHLHEYDRNSQFTSTNHTQCAGVRPFAPTRCLVIVDEYFGMVEHHSVSLEQLRQTLATIPFLIRRNHVEQIAAMEVMIWTLETYAEATVDTQSNELMHLIDIAHIRLDKKLKRKNAQVDFKDLIGALGGIRFDHQFHIKDPTLCREQRIRHQRLLQSLSYVYGSWAYYAKHKDHTMHTARLLIPENIKGCVVMDATAGANLVYELHEDSRKIEPPTGTRSYGNVIIHISPGHKVGKAYMNSNSKELTNQLIEDLNQRLSMREVLIVTHKGVENDFAKVKTNFNLHVGHWGKIDGSNSWKDCDAVVIFGLPYLPLNWSPDVFMSIQGPQETKWFIDNDCRVHGEHQDIRKALEYGQMSTNIIQAINRVRCRKTIDQKGNCGPTDVYLMLPPSDQKLTETILHEIKAAMPGVRFEYDWN